VQKYFVAQGLGSGQRICIVGENAADFVGDVMWVSKSQVWKTPESEEEDEGEQSQKIKIAWRYEKMKQFKTTVNEYVVSML
jgi:elongator complex protein 4